MSDAILRANQRNALAVDAVLDDQQPAVFRHQCGHHAFNRGGAGGRHQHRRPLRRIQRVSRQQAAAAPRPADRKTRFRGGKDLAAADCAVTRSLKVTGPGLSSSTRNTPAGAPMCRIRRVFTSTGVTDWPRQIAGVPARMNKRAKRATIERREQLQPARRFAQDRSVSSDAA